MPFGITSAPEVFQRRMHELIKGLSGTDDEIIVAGLGDSLEEVFRDHNKKLFCLYLAMFRTWCQARCGKTSAVLGGSPLNW